MYISLPELVLNPKENSYGPDYQSGQIRIAFTPGNTDISKKLYGGCILGSSPEARKFAIREMVTDRSWCDDFHIYRIRWTNGNYLKEFLYRDITIALSYREYLAKCRRTRIRYNCATRRWLFHSKRQS